MYHALPNHLFYRAARHEANPALVTLWNIIANLDPEPIVLMGKMMSAGAIIMQIAQSGTDPLPSVNHTPPPKKPLPHLSSPCLPFCNSCILIRLRTRVQQKFETL